MRNSGMIVEQLKTADDQDFLRFRKNISDIVTVKGGLIETTDEQKKICIIYKNGDFLISTEHLENPSIRFLKEVAIRKGIQNITCYKVSLRDIRLLYQEQEKKVIQSSSLPMEKIASDPSAVKAEKRTLDAVKPGQAIITCNPFFRFSMRMVSSSPVMANFDAE